VRFGLIGLASLGLGSVLLALIWPAVALPLLITAFGIILLGQLGYHLIQHVQTRRTFVEQATHYQAIFEAVADAILVHAAGSGQILDANGHACRLFGYTRTALQQRTIHDLLPSEEASGVGAVLLAAHTHPGQIFVGLHILCADGTRLPVELIPSRVIETAAQSAVILVIRDIRAQLRTETDLVAANAALEQRVAQRTEELVQTNHQLQAQIAERIQIEQYLRESEAQYRILVEQSLQSVFVLQDQRLVFVNPALEQLTGYPMAELLKWEFSQLLLLIPPDDRAALVERLQARVAGNAIEGPAQARFLHRDGSMRWTTLAISATTFQHQPALLGVAVDITALKTAETALRQSHDELTLINTDLQRVMQLKDDFLANMSHELRTPLNTILGRSESLLEQIYGPINPQQVRAIESIIESSEHLLTLINDVLDLSKIEAGAITLEFKPIYLEDLCLALKRMIAPAAQTRNISVLMSNLQPELQMIGDERRLRQILLNLLANAVKFTPEGGQVGLDISHDEATQTISFTVWDTGIGIAAEQMPLLFQPFVQLNGGLARVYEGTGLGLALVARLTNLHNGSVHVTSTPGAGSQFTVTLPQG
jgi:PAS domain S-box-containing protein